MRILACVFLLAVGEAAEIRLGIIGTDTSHVIAFTKALNDPKAPDHVPGARVVAAYKGGSPDVEASRSRIDKFAEQLRSEFKVDFVPDIATLCRSVDGILLESVDARVHLALARQVIAAKKPMFIDKPMAATLDDAREIARLAAQAGVPWFSASRHRYGIPVAMKASDIRSALAWGPGPIEKYLPLDLAWYGIHSIEMLYGMLGPGCEEVSRTATADGDVVVGRWKGGRIGTVQLLRTSSSYGAVTFRAGKVVQSTPEMSAEFGPLLRQVMKFFQTGAPPVPNEETLEVFAFMDAAQRSKESGGRPTRLR